MVGPMDKIIAKNKKKTSKATNTQNTMILKEDLPAGLKKIYPGLYSSSDITCLTIKRQILLCGTSCGSLLVFKARPKDAGYENSTSKFCFESPPLAKIKLSAIPITQVDLGFAEDAILFFGR